MIDPHGKIPYSEIGPRIETLQSLLRNASIEGALILQKADLYYFSGTVQDAHLYIPSAGIPVLMVYKNFDRAAAESSIKTILPLKNPRDLPHLLAHEGTVLPSVLGMELDVLPVNLYFSYKQIFPDSRIQDISSVIRMIRSVKSPYEIEQIRCCAQLADQVSAKTREFLREGITEIELAGKLEAHARKLGHQGIIRMRLWGSELFYGHLMAGSSGAVPSYLSSPTGGTGVSPATGQGAGFKAIRKHEPVLVDYVFAINGYLADHARIFSIGRLPGHLEKSHRLMLELQTYIKTMAKPGVKSGKLYDLAIDFVSCHGLETHFMGADSQRIRFIGHGVGLELDEYPFLAKGQDLPLKTGMTLALEPKLVFPGEGVVGIENTHLVTENGLEQLTCFDEEVIVL